MIQDEIRAFVELWGTMGSIWGINTSVARVHALLLASDGSFTLDEIAEALGIAKSNASTCLKELRGWGVVKKVASPGERKERFACEPDVWAMLFNIARERKRREFEPALRAVQETLSKVDGGAPGVASERLHQLESVFATMDEVAERALQNEGTARAFLAFLGGR